MAERGRDPDDGAGARTRTIHGEIGAGGAGNHSLTLCPYFRIGAHMAHQGFVDFEKLVNLVAGFGIVSRHADADLSVQERDFI